MSYLQSLAAPAVGPAVPLEASLAAREAPQIEPALEVEASVEAAPALPRLDSPSEPDVAPRHEPSPSAATSPQPAPEAALRAAFEWVAAAPTNLPERENQGGSAPPAARQATVQSPRDTRPATAALPAAAPPELPRPRARADEPRTIAPAAVPYLDLDPRPAVLPARRAERVLMSLAMAPAALPDEAVPPFGRPPRQDAELRTVAAEPSRSRPHAGAEPMPPLGRPAVHVHIGAIALSVKPPVPAPAARPPAAAPAAKRPSAGLAFAASRHYLRWS